jgi:thermitase
VRRAISLLVPLLALVATDVPAGAATLTRAPVRRVAADAPSSAPARLIVRFRAAADSADRARARDAVDAVSTRRLDLPKTELVRLARGRSVAAALRRLRARRDVEFAQADYAYRPESIPNDGLFGQQWGLNNVGQTGLLFPAGTPDADIDAPEAWDLTTGSDSVVVGVIDTGVDAAHADLAPNVDTADAHDFINDDGNASDDVEAHGTLVASVIGARGNNGIGISGVAQRVKLLPLQVADLNGTLFTSDIVDAVGYARDHGARVINMSFGSFAPAEDPALVSAIEASPNVLFSASAGNLNGLNQPNDNDAAPHWPSNLTTDPGANVIASANTDNTDALDASSSFGRLTVDLGAPGTEIAGAAATDTVFSENFDGVAAGALPAGWTTTGTWTTSDEDPPMPSAPNTLTDSPGGDYVANSDTAATSPSFTVPAGGACTVTNTRRRDTEPDKDFFLTEVSLDGAAFTTIESRSGDTQGDYRVGSPRFATGTATQAALRFRLTSDATTNADGVHIDDVTVDCAPATDGYVSGSGTSFAAPMVSGAAALLLARDPTLTAAQLKSTLRATVDPLASLNGKVSTGGRLNVARALRSLTAPSATAAAAASARRAPSCTARPTRRARRRRPTSSIARWARSSGPRSARRRSRKAAPRSRSTPPSAGSRPIRRTSSVSWPRSRCAPARVSR